MISKGYTKSITQLNLLNQWEWYNHKSKDTSKERKKDNPKKTLALTREEWNEEHTK